MRQRNSAPKDSADYRTSWEYWAAIHGYPGKTSPTGTIAAFQQLIANRFPDDAPLFSGFFAGLRDLDRPAMPSGLAAKIWATCEHGTPQFLAWHRMYLYYFERVLRAASGDPNFALPYWDYTNDASPGTADSPIRLPAVFAAPKLNGSNGPVDNPLYERRRTADFGLLVQLDPVQTDVDSTLALTDFTEFQTQLGSGLHGFIHCAVGNRCLAPYIGLVPFSANDPIFWVHHANVDRLWSCWSARNGETANPVNDIAWMGQEYFFVDERGDRVSMRVSDLFGPNKKIDSAYDNERKCFRREPAGGAVVAENMPNPESASVARSQTSTFAGASDVKVNQLTQKIPLGPAHSHLQGEMMPAGRSSPNRPVRAKLKLEGVKVTSEPGASVKVYLGIGSSKPVFVGVMNFFHALDGMHAEHETAGRDYFFDVSRQLQDLSAADAGNRDLHLVLEASSGLVGPAPVEGERYQKAGLTIRNVSLDLTSAEGPRDLK